MHYIIETNTKASFYSREQNLQDPNPRCYIPQPWRNFSGLGFPSSQLVPCM